MKTVKTFARQFSFGLMMAVTLGSAVVSCDSILDEDDVDCSVEYRVKFKYDYNMKYADAFSREVSSVALYAFDDNGKLVYQKTEAGGVLGGDGLPVGLGSRWLLDGGRYGAGRLPPHYMGRFERRGFILCSFDYAGSVFTRRTSM